MNESATESAGPMVRDERLGAWIAGDAGTCRAALVHESLSPPPYVELYGALEERFGLDFSNLRLAFGHIPLCLHGAAHADARKAIAARLARSRGAALESMDARVARHFGALGRPGRVELMAEAVEPFVADLMGTLIGIPDAGLPPDTLVSRIFSRGMGIAKRRRAEQEVGELRARIEAAGSAGDADTGHRLAMMILGRDALTGTLAESLAEILAAAQGEPLSALAFPELPPRTGVPYIERMAHEPCRIGGVALAAGDRVRIMLRVFGDTGDARDRAQFFGAGAHTCLGRPVSLAAWAAIGRHLAGLDTRVTIVDRAARADDIFAVPARLELEIRR